MEQSNERSERKEIYAGPFQNIPFDNYIQSPIGLVPKHGGKDTRLIFHLSYPRGKGTSVNANTPEHMCHVKYPDFNDAIQLCIVEGKACYIAKSDMKSAFRNLGIMKKHWKYLIMKAVSPIDGKTLFCGQVPPIWSINLLFSFPDTQQCY